MAEIFADEKFAVVDLETTGTQRENDNHIIQFGCALVKGLEVVETYSFMINPHREIPIAVQNLTGIHNEDVADQPDFSYYAPKIIEILKDATFVAHNVDFDLPFLNYELANYGFDTLSNRAIDTVELAKIAFPTLPSYKLGDLTHALNIKHLDPHKADSDAYGTAMLLINIIKKFQQLPQATLNTLSSLAGGLVRDTSWIFKTIADDYRKHKYPLAKNYIQVRNIILQRQETPKGRSFASGDKFSENDGSKKKLFKDHLNYRRAQVKLINQINQFLEQDNQRAMLVEAPNGTGKTFSYLFAYAYRLYSSRKLVIAVPTKILQEQVIKQEIPQLLAVTKLDLTAEEVKSSSHYIDLDGFVQSIFQSTNNKPALVLKMRILVWLTETKTGDLDELQLTSYNDPLFTQISHPGDARVGTNFASVDFWNLARQREEAADILVTNHAYLANHYTDSIWGQNPYLVIDEAHRFAENMTTSRNDYLQFEAIWGTLSHLRHILTFSDESLQNALNDNASFNFELKKLDSKILDLIYRINDLQKYLYNQKDHASNTIKLPNGSNNLSFLGKVLFPENSSFRGLFQNFQNSLEDVRQSTSTLLFSLYHEGNSFVFTNEALLNEISEQIDKLDFYAEKSYQLADMINDFDHLDEKGFVVQITNEADPLSANLHWLMLNVTPELTMLYQRFDHMLFVSATLTNNKNFDFAINQLALAPLFPLTYIGNSTFNLKEHLQSYVISDMPVPSDPDFTHELAQILISDFSTQNHVLVLMTNLEQIRNLFELIVESEAFKDYEILAQGITGSNNKIAKRFEIAQKAIILGADSFWEGIDFHGCGIDDVIVAKLPFESPDYPEVRLRQQLLERKQISVFENDMLPRAIIRFRQGIGRLIRGENDYGSFIVLDNRILSMDYGKAFLESIPVASKIISKIDLRDEIDKHDK